MSDVRRQVVIGLAGGAPALHRVRWRGASSTSTRNSRIQGDGLDAGRADSVSGDFSKAVFLETDV